MKKSPLILHKGFAAGRGEDPRDVETVTEALRTMGFLKRPTPGGAAPSPADLDGGLRRFQDREGLVVDGIAAPRGRTEAELRKSVARAAVLAARPPRTEPLRFRPVADGSIREFDAMVRGLLRRTDQRGALKLFRQAFEDAPEEAVPEAIYFTELVEGKSREKGRRFRAALVKTAREVDPALAPHIAAGRIVPDLVLRPGDSLLSQAASGVTAASARAQADGDVADGEKSEDDATELARTVPPSRVKDRAQEILERTGDLDEAAEAARQEAEPGEAEGLVAAGTLRGVIVGFRAKGYGDAADALSHYLEGEGADINFAPEEIRKYKIIQFAEEDNRDRITGRLFAQPGGFFSGQAVVAEQTGYAARYNRGSGWTQRVRITIPVVDGRLGTPRAEWEDTDAAVDWKTWKPTKPLD